MVDRKDCGPPKVGEKSPKVSGPFEKGNCRFVFFIQKRAYFVRKKAIVKIDDLKKIEKPPKVRDLPRTEGSEKEDVTLDCKDCGPPKVGEKLPKLGGPFEKGHCRF